MFKASLIAATMSPSEVPIWASILFCIALIIVEICGGYLFLKIACRSVVIKVPVFDLSDDFDYDNDYESDDTAENEKKGNQMQAELTPAEYMNVLFKRSESLNELYQEFIAQSIVLCRIKVTDIPVNIIVSSSSIYLSVFRIARSSCNWAVSVFNSIIAEYESVSGEEDFMKQLSYFLNDCDRLFCNEKEYQSFRDSIPEEVLKNLELMLQQNKELKVSKPPIIKLNRAELKDSGMFLG